MSDAGRFNYGGPVPGPGNGSKGRQRASQRAGKSILPWDEPIAWAQFGVLGALIVCELDRHTVAVIVLCAVYIVLAMASAAVQHRRKKSKR